MNNIVQVDQYSKLSKEYKRKYDASVNYYLKDFYEKNEMPPQHSVASEGEENEDDMQREQLRYSHTVFY